MLDTLLQVFIGPDVNVYQPLMAAVVNEWLAKQRRKIAKVPTKDF